MDGRIALKVGCYLNFPGMNCVVQEEIGRGSNALVYRGWYEDALTRGERHHVLIKELFPLHPKGMIFRGEDNRVNRTEDAEDFWLLHQESFERGNRAHLKLLEASPDIVGGNLNTFFLNQTFYTVLDYTGGRSLEQDIKLRGLAPLRTTAVRMLGLLRALEAFHGLGLVHLDISPDNALLIGQGDAERVMLIDYNSVHSLRELRGGQASFHSVKPGYTAPEVRTASISGIGMPADLFSVTAVFYTCLTGQALTPFDLTRREPPDVSDCEPLWEAPEPVARMIRTILKRGLCAVANRRYQTIAQMATDFRELIDRIDGVGITHWALWEAGRQQVAGMIRMNPAMDYIRSEDSLYPARAQTGDGSVLPIDEAVDLLLVKPGQATLLLGPGGIGKTTALLSTACRLGKRYSPSVPAVMYISLYGWTTGNPHYITDKLLEYLRFREGSQNMDSARHALHELLSRPITHRGREKPQVLLLIDGVNETPAENDALLRELNTLRAMPGVGMILSSRSEVSGMEMPVMTLSPLMMNDVTQVLGSNGLAMPESNEIQRLLCTPLMLSIFVTTARNSGRQVMISTADELLAAYFAALLEKEERDQGDGSPARWQNAAAIHLVLPAIAAACARMDRPLTASELLETIARCRKIITSGNLKKLFPHWVGHSRDILGGTRTEEEWLGLMVQKTLWQHLGLLLQDRNGGFHPTHQELAEYLQRVHAAQMRIVSRRRGKLIALTAAMTTLVLATGAYTAQVLEQRRQEAAYQAYLDTLYNENMAQSVYERAELAYIDAEKWVEQMLRVMENPHDSEAISAMYAGLNALKASESQERLPEIDKDVELLGAMLGMDLRQLFPDGEDLSWSMIEAANPSLKENRKLIPWSGKPLDLEACYNLFCFRKNIMDEYLKYLGMLEYVQHDPMAQHFAYEEKALPYLREMVNSDARFLVGSYILVCGPHTQDAWAEYRGNTSDSYMLYTITKRELPDDEELLRNAVAEAANVRPKTYADASFQQLLIGYQEWESEGKYDSYFGII